jgi:hypothetical protein
MKQTLLLSLSLLLFFSCAVQKRKYQKGYYISWNRSSTAKKEKNPEAWGSKSGRLELAAAQPLSPIAIGPALHHGNTGTASFPQNQKRELVTTLKNLEKQPVQKDEGCDDLIFKDGSEVKGKVTEISSTEVKYKKCDLPDGPVYVVKKSELFMIKYANGTREVFKDEVKPKPEKPKSDTLKRVHPMAVAAFILGIVSFILFFIGIIPAILAIVFGDVAQGQIKRQPDLYEGEVLARIGKILGIVYLVILFFALMLLLIAFMSFV